MRPKAFSGVGDTLRGLVWYRRTQVASVATQFLSNQDNKQMMMRQIDEQIKDNERQREIARKILAKQDLDAAARKAEMEKLKLLEAEAFKLNAQRREAMFNTKIELDDPDRKAQGGVVNKGYFKGGYVESRRGGVADNIRMKVPANSYIMDATSVSLIGDGNSDAGGKRLDDWIREKDASIHRSNIYNLTRHTPSVSTFRFSSVAESMLFYLSM